MKEKTYIDRKSSYRLRLVVKSKVLEMLRIICFTFFSVIIVKRKKIHSYY